MVVKKKLDKELGFNRISGTYTFKTFDNFICFPLGLVPKNVKGECNSVNKHIPRDKVVVLYESVENLIHLIEKFGKGALMAKLYIEDN